MRTNREKSRITVIVVLVSSKSDPIKAIKRTNSKSSDALLKKYCVFLSVVDHFSLAFGNFPLAPTVVPRVLPWLSTMPALAGMNSTDESGWEYM